jgi:hypothetical protein
VNRQPDRDGPCCRNIYSIAPGEAPHTSELIYADCGQRRGWLSQASTKFLSGVIGPLRPPGRP